MVIGHGYCGYSPAPENWKNQSLNKFGFPSAINLAYLVILSMDQSHQFKPSMPPEPCEPY